MVFHIKFIVSPRLVSDPGPYLRTTFQQARHRQKYFESYWHLMLILKYQSQFHFIHKGGGVVVSHFIAFKLSSNTNTNYILIQHLSRLLLFTANSNTTVKLLLICIYIFSSQTVMLRLFSEPCLSKLVKNGLCSCGLSQMEIVPLRIKAWELWKCGIKIRFTLLFLLPKETRSVVESCWDSNVGSTRSHSCNVLLTSWHFSYLEW